jgi:hypothetical protein
MSKVDRIKVADFKLLFFVDPQPIDEIARLRSKTRHDGIADPHIKNFS